MSDIEWSVSCSKYTIDGKYVRDLPPVYTIGELMELIKNLPAHLPISSGYEDGIKLIWVNVGCNHEGCVIDD